MAEAKWYVVHTYSGYENKVKANIDKTIENRHLEDEILEVLCSDAGSCRIEERRTESVSEKDVSGICSDPHDHER